MACADSLVSACGGDTRAARAVASTAAKRHLLIGELDLAEFYAETCALLDMRAILGPRVIQGVLPL